ncbi:MAG: undecaprenyldiphospho-muramoylpentapeptide beta-N-acetylglucosaminyltransferase [Clostridiales bacterium]|jgi:UDP-N-acetylglucosamine--N-acetylmuramyl-(pentapeptide) pyrophosphoryl-undecaprenol N-acetylglucosamine transferase|nr:undecaprenyldiphospho-muramoylpentapeptide beta-N-acetylglucosaminyltransferase [Clostridiales bacterium]
MKKKKIILAGGGTAGHVNPNIALLPELSRAGFEAVYIGSENGIEKKLVTDAGIPFYGICSGKLRRYASLKNFTDAFRVVKGVGDAFSVIMKEKPKIIFSKGGFVCVPVIFAAKLAGVPVVAHESDVTPGLTNKIAYPLAKAVCATFPETMQYIPKNKGILTGAPLRKELFSGSKKKGLSFCGFSGKKPVLLIMGGSSGAVKINKAVRSVLEKMTNTFDVIHLCGKGNTDPLLKTQGYVQFEYISNELGDLLACCDIVLSRAGSNAIFEFLSLCKPSVLVPLSKKASRGDQILNADIFQKSGYCAVINEENLTGEVILEKMSEVYANREYYINNMKNAKACDGVAEIIKVLQKYSKP